jgi:hypothetical protein
MNKDIWMMLRTFQQGYTDKDVTRIEPYMDALFDEDVEVAVIGTGNTELFATKEAVRELIEGDWQYWGDLSLSLEEATVREFERSSLVVVPGTLSYRFQEVEQTYDRYKEYMQEILAGVDQSQLTSMIHGQSMVQYVLDLFLHKRPETERYDSYPIGVVFFLNNTEQGPKIRALTFTNAPNGRYPDIRVHPFTAYHDYLGQCSKAMARVGRPTALPSFTEMALSDDLLFVDVDLHVYEQEAAKEAWRNRLRLYDTLQVDETLGLWSDDGERVAVVYTGQVEQRIDTEMARLDLMERIERVFASDSPAKDQLFAVRREIAMVNKETALGEEHHWPVRVLVVCHRTNDGYTIDLLQLGYPMDAILEGKFLGGFGSS